MLDFVGFEFYTLSGNPGLAGFPPQEHCAQAGGRALAFADQPCQSGLFVIFPYHRFWVCVC